jgi:ABC-type Zn uptake system ZnuABC Zn-binding protein ZnuA
MLDLQQIKDKLKERRLPVVARETGLHYNTVRKIAADADVDVSYLTVKRISDYLERS